jgi:hypothetical protein
VTSIYERLLGQHAPELALRGTKQPRITPLNSVYDDTAVRRPPLTKLFSASPNSCNVFSTPL